MNFSEHWKQAEISSRHLADLRACREVSDLNRGAKQSLVFSKKEAEMVRIESEKSSGSQNDADLLAVGGGRATSAREVAEKSVPIPCEPLSEEWSLVSPTADVSPKQECWKGDTFSYVPSNDWSDNRALFGKGLITFEDEFTQVLGLSELGMTRLLASGYSNDGTRVVTGDPRQLPAYQESNLELARDCVVERKSSARGG